MLCKIPYVCISHAGKVRQANQDNFICDGQYMQPNDNDFPFPLQGVCPNVNMPLFGVFDGMGGEQRGEIAAYIAAKHAAELHNPSGKVSALLRLCDTANQAICNYAAENHVTSTGTTAAMLLFSKRTLSLCNIGDSKIFRFRQGALEQLSTDHLGIAPFGVKPPLSQSLGIPPEEMRITPYTLKARYEPEDIYLICSDGLTDMVTKEDIAKVLSGSPLQPAAEQLLALALANGGRDNVTFVLCRIDKEIPKLFHRKREV